MSWKSYAESVDEAPLSDEAGERNEQESLKSFQVLLASRARVLIAGFVVIMLVMIARLAHWQLIGRQEAQPSIAYAAEPSRGRIVDRSGLLLATDDFIREVYARPQALYTSPISRTVLISLTEVLDMPTSALMDHLRIDQPLVVLSKEATQAQCEAIDQELDARDLTWCDTRRKRTYPQGSLAAHLIGFTNYKREGIYGVEASYDQWLRSDGEWPSYRFPSPPQPLPDDWRVYLPSPTGQDLVLYLDAPLQSMVERRLQDAVSYYEAEAGTIIIMDPRSGGVLAMANYPTFDPNHYSQVEADTWVNSAIGKIYEPGSVFKVVTMGAALDAGKITPETYFEDTGSIEVLNRSIRNAEGRSYGLVTTTEALAKSINVVTARISLDMSPEAFYGYVRRFGFGKLTEVDLNLESAGIVKERGRSNDWSVFDQATNSFGQGISVTAFQMINAVAAVANKGVLLQPRIVRGMVEDGQIYELPPHIIGRPIKAETARALTEMMVYTVENASYAELVPGYRLAGKTGTAEIPTDEGYTLPETITSFIGFLPADDPQIVIMVKLDEPKKSRWAEQVVVPVFGEVARDAVRILQIAPN